MTRDSTNIRACIFDLDGTLLNSLEDLADAVNTALRASGFPVHPVDAYRFFVGSGMRALVSRAAPAGADENTLASLREDVRARYAENWAVKTRPYPGIMPMLERLSGRGLPLAVLSNKPHDSTLLCVRRFFPGITFARVQGCPEQGRPKPDPALALDIARQFGLEPAHILFLGDSSVDMDTAVAAGMFPVGVRWGFRPEDELKAHGAAALLSAPEEIFSLLGG